MWPTYIIEGNLLFVYLNINFFHNTLIKTPKIMSTNVVFPDPEEPINATDEFFGIVKSTPDKTFFSVSGYLNVIPLNSISFSYRISDKSVSSLRNGRITS